MKNKIKIVQFIVRNISTILLLIICATTIKFMWMLVYPNQPMIGWMWVAIFIWVTVKDIIINEHRL